MERKKKWSDTNLITLAQQFTSLKDFRKNHGSAYSAIHQRGLRDEAYSHMKRKMGVVERSFLYRYLHPEGYVYIGITNDPDHRHTMHTANPMNELVALCTEDSIPDLFERYVEYKGTFEPYEMERTTALRFERMQIRKAVADGWKVVNKHHNPQYQNGTYSWET